MRPVNFLAQQNDRTSPSHHVKAGAFLFALSGVAALLISVIYVARPTFASGPSSNRVLNYQIRLTDATGIPVADGTKDIKLSFYDAASGGTRLATDCGTTVTPVARKVVFTNGTGSVLLGDTGADGTHNCADASAPNALASSLFSNPVLYLGITVGTDAEMTPRKRIVAQGYALNADLLDDLDTSSIGGSVAFIPATDGSGNLTLTKDLNVDSATLFVDSANGRVGVGTAAPATRLQVTGDTAVTGDYFVDSDGSSLNDHGYFITPIAEGAPLVSAAGQGLCTDSLTTPTKVYMDGNGDCTPGNGGADAVLVFDSAGATVAVTSAWAFNDADTDCDGDGTGGDGGCTASDGIYQDGQDLYVDHTPSATFNSADVGIGTDTPLANLHIIGTGLGNDFADYPAVVAIETQSSTQWSLVFQTRDAGLGKLMGFYQQSFAPFSPFFDSNGGSLLLASDNVIDSIQAWSETDRRTAIGLFDTWSTLAVRSDADKTGLVGTTTANASTTITGVGTMFLRDLGVGDRISLSSAPTVYATVTSITDDLTLAIDAPLGDGTSQTINRKSGILRLEDGNGAVVAAVNDQGRMGVGVINPESQLTVGQNALPIGSIFGGSDGISVSKTLTAYGTAGQFQAVWDFPSAGFGITGTVSVAQTRDTNANNMTGVMTGSQGIAEHLGPGSATEIVGVQGGAYDRVGGTTADAIGVWGTTTAQTSTITNAVGVRGENNIFSSGNITNAFAVAARQGSLTSGTIAGNVGLQVDDFTVGTNKTDVLVGTQTIPAGNFSLYNASSYDSYFAGKLGVGTAAPGQLLDVRGRAAVGAQTASNFWPSDLNTLLVNEQSADTGTAHTGVQSDIEWNPAASSAAFTTYASGKYSAATTASNAFNLTNGFVEGVIASAHHEGTGTVGNLIGAEGLATNTTTGTVTTATGLTATAQTVAAGGTITTAYGGRFRVSTFGGAITNGYAVQARDGSVSGGGSIASKAGVDIEEITNATNNTDLLIGTATIPGGNYALYNASTRDTYFAGNVGIGDATPAAAFVVGSGDLFRVAGASGNVQTAGDLAVNGNSTLGDASSDTIAANGEFTTSLIPSVDNVIELGSTSNRWAGLHLGPGSLVVHNDATDTNKATIDFSGATARLVTDAATPLKVTTGANVGLNVDTSGQVGVGTASPAALFSVGASSQFQVDASGNVVTSGTITSGSGQAFVQNGNTLGAAAVLGTNDNFAFNVETNGTTRMTLDTSGNLGLGTTTPGGVIHIVTESASPMMYDRYGGAPPNIIFRRANGTIALPTAVTTDNQLFAIGGRGYGATGFSASGRAAMFGAASETWTDSAQGAYLAFNTTAIGTAAAAERVRISDAGNVGIGSSAPPARLTVSGGDALVTNGNLITPFGGQGGYENYVMYSDQFNNGAWVKTGVTVTADATTAPDGSTGADQIAGGAIATDGVKEVANNPYTMLVGYGNKTWTGSVWLRANSGTPSVTLKLDSNSTSQAFTQAVTLSTSWQRYSVTATYTTGSGYPIFEIQTGTNTVFAWGAQIEYASAPGVYARTESVPVATSDAATVGRGFIGNGSFLISGTLADAPTAGAGGRLMWVPNKQAFRAGYVAGSNWDDSNLGTYSAAFGNDTKASGFYSFAGGNQSTATTSNAFAYGAVANATGFASVALGSAANATGSVSVALGGNAFASGGSSMAFGSDISASSTVSVAFGHYVNANVDHAMVIGHGVDTVNRLSNNAVDSLMVGFNSTVPTLFVGPSRGAGTTGAVGIGSSTKLSALTVTPSADVSNIGGTTTASASTTITGTGTTFLASLGVGDRISLSSAPSTYATVTAIASDTSLTVDAALGNGTSQTINKKASVFRLDRASGTTGMVMSDQGFLGIGTAAPSFDLDISGSSGIRVSEPSSYGLTLKSTSGSSDFMGIRWKDSANANLWSMGDDYNGNGNQDFWLYDNVNGNTVLLADQAATSYLSFGTTNGGLQYDNATQQLSLFTNGTLKMYVTGAGDVGIGDATPDAAFDIDQAAASSGTPKLVSWTGGAHTGLTASTEAVDVDLALNRTVQFATGALSTQRAVVVRQPTYAFAGASTLSVAGTMNVVGAPVAGTNATITNAAAFIAGDLSGETSAAGSAASMISLVPGITNGVGASNRRIGLWVTTPVGDVALGDQTATLTDFNAGRIDDVTLNSTTNTRTVTNASSLYVRGAPTVGTNVTVTNGPYAIHVDDGDTRLDGGLLLDSSGALVDFASGTAGNTIKWKVPTLASGTCSSGAAEGVTILDAGNTQRGHICIDSGTPLLKFYANQFNTTSTDIAELYSTRPEDGIEPGDVVELDPAGDLMVRKTGEKSAAGTFGVVSTAPGIVLSGIDEATGKGDTAHGVNVALKGRVPVKVNMENGPIAVGDYLTSSSAPGIAMKATGNGMVIGRALDAATEGGTIRAFIEVGWWNGTEVLGATTTSGAGGLGVLTVGVTDFDGHDLINARSIHGIGDAWSISEDGTVAAKGVVTDAVSVRQTDEKTTLDRAVIPSGQDYAQVHNAAITPDSRVFITMKKNPGSQWWVDEVGEGFLVVKTAQPVVEDIPFDYWLVDAIDERTPPATVEPPATAPEPAPAPEEATADAASTAQQDPSPAAESAPDETMTTDPATAPADAPADATIQPDQVPAQ